MNSCLRCGPTEKKLNGRGFCYVCYSALERKATIRQTREDMHGWLHTRADRYGRPFTDDMHDAALVRRRVAVARRAGIEWWEPIVRQTHPQLMEQVLKESGAAPSQRGEQLAKARATRAKGVSTPLGA